MKMYIAFVLFALIVSSYGKPLAQKEREKIEEDAREIITKNVDIKFKWTIFQNTHPTDGSKPDFKSMTNQLDEMCRGYTPGSDAPKVAGDMHHLCELIHTLKTSS